jgi:hypothetical protein
METFADSPNSQPEGADAEVVSTGCAVDHNGHTYLDLLPVFTLKPNALQSPPLMTWLIAQT